MCVSAYDALPTEILLFSTLAMTVVRSCRRRHGSEVTLKCRMLVSEAKMETFPAYGVIGTDIQELDSGSSYSHIRRHLLICLDGELDSQGVEIPAYY